MKPMLPFLVAASLCWGLLCPFSGTAQTLSRTDRFFIEKGIQFQTWMTSAKPMAGRPTAFQPNRMGRYVRIQLNYWGRQSLSIAEVEVFSSGVNVALGKDASQISTEPGDGAAPAGLAVDGNTSTTSKTWFANDVRQQWWDVDLGQAYMINSIRLWNTNQADSINLSDYYVFVGNDPFPDQIVDSTLNMDGVTSYRQEGPVRRFAKGEEWDNLHFTGPTWYEPSMYNEEFFEQHPNSQWAMALAPYGTWKVNRDTQTVEAANGFLTPQQFEKLDQLTTICFGDEEVWKKAIDCDPKVKEIANLLDLYEKWFALSKEKYPNALVHSNQWPDYWKEEDLRTYSQQAKPDLLTFDRYVFRPTLSICPFIDDSVGYAGGSLYRTFNYLGMYRRVALEGHDGSGRTPIAFGQYLQGVRLNQGAGTDGYVISESQLFGHGFATLLMGGKWLNAWRYELDHEVEGSKNFWILPNGELSPRYYQYSKLARLVRNLSPHLSRLVTTDVRIAQGKHMQGGTEILNIRPDGMAAWSADADPYITSISATNPENGTNNGLPGDVYIGYFKPVNGIATAPGITMAPIPHEDTKYFMVLNGLTKANGCCGIGADTTLGISYRARQTITFNIDFENNPVDSLFRVNKFSGKAEKVTLTPGIGNTYSFTITDLPGGFAELFYWKNAHNSGFENLALNKAATQSSDLPSGGGHAELAVDGNSSGDYFQGSVSHTNAGTGDQNWWQVDLGKLADISTVRIFNRTDCCEHRLVNYHVFVSDSAFTGNTVSEIQNQPGVSDFSQSDIALSPTSVAVNRTGRYVRIQLESTLALHMAEVEVIGKYVNLARNKPVSQSSDLDVPQGYSELAVDGNTDGNYFNGSVTHTKAIAGEQSWWQIDLQGLTDIRDISIYNRTDCCKERLDTFYVFVSDTPFVGNSVSEIQSQPGVKEFLYESETGDEDLMSIPINHTGGYIRIQLHDPGERLSLAEVVITGKPLNVAPGHAVLQSSDLDAVKGHAELAVDGNTDGTYSRGSVTHTNTVSGEQSWWQIDLADTVNIQSLNIFNRSDCCFSRLEKFHVFVSKAPFAGNTVSEIQSQPGVIDIFHADTAGRPTNIPVYGSGRYVRIQLEDADTALSLAEVQIFGEPEESASLSPLLKSAAQAEDADQQLIEAIIADDTERVRRVNMYPNPARSTVALEFKLESASPVTVSVHDLMGKPIWEDEYQFGEGAHIVRFPMAGALPGVYIVEIGTRSWKESLRLIVN